MREIFTCPICDSPKSSFKLLYILNDKIHDVGGQYRVVECGNCGLFFINPQPAREELKKHYPADYYSFISNPPPRYYGKSLAAKLMTAFRHPIDAVVSLLELPLRRREIFQHNARLLDIGCGQGEFLQRLRRKPRYNMQLYGVDIGDVDVESMRKESINFFKGDLLDAGFEDGFFDIITLNHVLEHMEDPVRTFKEISRILKKDGRLVIGIPNTQSATYFLFKENSVQLDVPRHLFDYSVCTIKLLAEKTGFKIINLRYTSSPFQFLGSLEYALNKFRKNKVFLSESKLINNQSLKALLYPLCYLFNMLRIGDQIEVTLKKSDD